MTLSVSSLTEADIRQMAGDCAAYRAALLELMRNAQTVGRSGGAPSEWARAVTMYVMTVVGRRREWPVAGVETEMARPMAS